MLSYILFALILGNMVQGKWRRGQSLKLTQDSWRSLKSVLITNFINFIRIDIAGEDGVSKSKMLSKGVLICI